MYLKNSIANNKHKHETFYSGKPITFSTYLDANNLYQRAMSKCLQILLFTFTYDLLNTPVVLTLRDPNDNLNN